MVQYFLCFLFGVIISLFSHWVRAEILFEGYSKVLSGGVHCGYIVNRYEFDEKKKQFISIYFLKTNPHCSSLTESLKAYAAADMTPISYEYTSLTGSVAKSIDATFEKDKKTKGIKMIAVVKDGSNQQRIIKDLSKGTFLSTFLSYVILKSPSGLRVDTKYEYKAIAEEEADIVAGVAYVKNMDEFNGLKGFKVLNEFKKSKFTSLITEKGEVLNTKSPAQGIATELVIPPSVATNNMSVPTELLNNLFGNVPTGIKNELFRKTKESPPTTVALPVVPDKKYGIPKGEGLILKGTQAQPKKEEK